MGLGDLFDVDAAHVREDEGRQLADAVPDDTGVVLLLDVDLAADEQAARHVAAYLELENLLGLGLGFLGGIGEANAARLHPSAGQDLRLDHDRTADLPG